MKKIFIVAGELSGDQTAAWYLKKRSKIEKLEVHAVGGDNLYKAGANIYDSYKKLNIVGVVEVLSKLKFIFGYLKKLTDYITQNNFDEVVLVDFPGFNLILAKRLKQKNNKIKIIYLAPPQLWAWGAWRVKKLKKYCDNLVVLYPFEVAWYKKHGLNVEYLGTPLCDKLHDYIDLDLPVKKQITVLPGSRKQEIKKLLPLLASVIKRIKFLDSSIKIILPLAESLDKKFVEDELRKNGLLNNFGDNIKIITDEQEKIKELKQSFMAITKPGTVTLELALLNVPAIIFYKTSWITYFLAKLVVNIKVMGLPNLFLNKIIYKEFIQGNCTVDNIFKEIKNIYDGYLQNSGYYLNIKKNLKEVRDNLIKQ
ncbi:MAG: Lipid-A-disaccharide synthetase [candidate division TM6 bacterium GW2011_GWF2_28_16]|nr:MAG: Lipid-A-disaccharide synthetase [candidate division TM6 bacterium GW2011_GWF2_28_16]